MNRVRIRKGYVEVRLSGRWTPVATHTEGAALSIQGAIVEEIRERTKEMRDALESSMAALGDQLESQRLGGSGIKQEYARAVRKEIRAALLNPQRKEG